MITVAVGSKNPTKVKPVRNIFRKHFGGIKVVAVNVSSGISEQPMHEDETFQGALNRAKNALKLVKNADFGVGIEGGTHKYSFGWMEKSLVVIMGRDGSIGIGSSGGLVLPDKVITMLEHGKNLEEAVDELFGTTKIGEGMGMFGIFTKGVVTRIKGVEHGVAFALARFLHPDLY